MSLRRQQGPEVDWGATSLATWLDDITQETLEIIWDLEEGPDPQVEPFIEWKRADELMSTCKALFVEARNMRYELEDHFQRMDNDCPSPNLQLRGNKNQMKEMGQVDKCLSSMGENEGDLAEGDSNDCNGAKIITTTSQTAAMKTDVTTNDENSIATTMLLTVEEIAMATVTYTNSNDINGEGIFTNSNNNYIADGGHGPMAMTKSTTTAAITMTVKTTTLIATTTTKTTLQRITTHCLGSTGQHAEVNMGLQGDRGLGLRVTESPQLDRIGVG
ncbi:hypothetical protein CBR_g37383 [Chara braunii]|uniref:Uncharacterized protein n=1 Tax=Chara braunii TaxID=69332 RepID=A0A388JZU3_CHABU|nr:hypothetical protein CBR_g37383 [Chara braunii]|eukprot:GBG63297.1 hypothetical protein CBR_g37383 [Chara braunii]